MDSRAYIDQLPAAAQDQLLGRLRTVEGWVMEYSRALGKRTPPRVKIAMKFTAYRPVSNVIVIPARLLMEADQKLLRIVVAHECGHFKRRWPSLFSWTTVARLKEEIRADRIAMTLTGASLDEWVKSLQEVADVEACSMDDELTKLRRQVLGEWLGGKRSGGCSD